MSTIPEIPVGQVAIRDTINASIREHYTYNAPRNANGQNISNVLALSCDSLFVAGLPVVSALVYNEVSAAVVTGSPTIYTFTARSLNGVSVFVNGAKRPRSSYAITGGPASLNFQNKDFEQSALAYWSPVGTTGTPSANPHSGYYSCALTSAGAYIFQILGGLVSGAGYRIFAWVRGDSSTTATITLMAHDGTGANVALAVSLLPVTTWQLVSIPYVANSTGNVGFSVQRGPSGAGSVYVDDVSIWGGYASSTYTITFSSAPPSGAEVSLTGLITV